MRWNEFDTVRVGTAMFSSTRSPRAGLAWIGSGQPVPFEEPSELERDILWFSNVDERDLPRSPRFLTVKGFDFLPVHPGAVLAEWGYDGRLRRPSETLAFVQRLFHTTTVATFDLLFRVDPAVSIRSLFAARSLEDAVASFVRKAGGSPSFREEQMASEPVDGPHAVVSRPRHIWARDAFRRAGIAPSASLEGRFAAAVEEMAASPKWTTCWNIGVVLQTLALALGLDSPCDREMEGLRVLGYEPVDLGRGRLAIPTGEGPDATKALREAAFSVGLLPTMCDNGPVADVPWGGDPAFRVASKFVWRSAREMLWNMLLIPLVEPPHGPLLPIPMRH